MNDVKYSTNNEKKMNCALQKAIGAYENGILGAQTISDTVIALGIKSCFPLTLQIYGKPTIIASDLILFDPNGGLSAYKNSMLGSFTYPSGVKPCSIMIDSGHDIYSCSCHAHLNKPEAVIYRNKDGTFGGGLFMNTTEIRKVSPNVKWAIGGCGLGRLYDPVKQGFVGKYGDVLNVNNHTVLGVKNNMLYGVYYAKMSGAQINSHVVEKMKFDFALLLDGGHLAAINGDEKFAKINVNEKQGYAIQFI